MFELLEIMYLINLVLRNNCYKSKCHKEYPHIDCKRFHTREIISYLSHYAKKRTNALFKEALIFVHEIVDKN